MIRLCIVSVVLVVIGVGATRAQSDYEKQALEILKLYEAGQTDTAYWLVEPLKRNARFIPAALYVRAQMTPDDRALNLYREIIALEPDGPWADESAHQLVRRYIEKKDSIAAWTWFGMLQKNYPQSQYIAKTKSLLGAVKSWEIVVDDEEDGEESETAEIATFEEVETAAKKDTAGSGQKKSEPVKPAVKTEEDAADGGFSGYALQVGLFPTKAAAEKRVKELQTKSLKPIIFPKEVKGKTQYALVVGPYKSLEEAGKAKPAVSKACECGAFTVQVE